MPAGADIGPPVASCQAGSRLGLPGPLNANGKRATLWLARKKEKDGEDKLLNWEAVHRRENKAMKFYPVGVGMPPILKLFCIC